ncbi:MAG: hypothetical protein ISR55_08970 [Bacteroidetes bacterium]|nr:hypothetical protein [Bacteroidota bacterium]
MNKFRSIACTSQAKMIFFSFQSLLLDRHLFIMTKYSDNDFFVDKRYKYPFFADSGPMTFLSIYIQIKKVAMLSNKTTFPDVFS